MIRVLKYIVEGVIVSIAAYLIGRGKLTTLEIVFIGLVALITLILIDLYPVSCQWIGMYSKPSQQPIQVTHPNRLDHPRDPEKPIQKELPDVTKVDLENMPYHFLDEYPPEPLPSTPKTHSLSLTKILSHWINWFQSINPLNQNTDEYQLYHGNYASLVVHPGYHENIQPANHNVIDQISPRIWLTNNPVDPINSKTETTYNGEKFKQQNSQMTGGANDNTNVEAQGVRLTNVIYSGDLIELTSGDNIIQRATTNSQVLLDRPLPKLRTNLSKLRFENMLDNGTLTPIKYGTNIYIKHNALVDNMNQSRFIKYGERVQSHQDGPLYEIFKLVSTENMNSQDYVKYGDSFLIACGDQPGDKIYLKLEGDKSISSEATVDDAIIFTAFLTKPYEQGKTNLCVCPNEIIFP